MDDQGDEFEGIDVGGPWGGVRVGRGGRRFRERDRDPEIRSIRRRVRRRLNFFRNVALYVVVVGGLAILDGVTGGGWWVQYVALIWGALLLLEAFTSFVAPMLWGGDVEDRMVMREVERRRGRVEVTNPSHPGSVEDPPPQA